MQSPKDPSSTLKRIEISQGLTAFQCPTTNGIWIDIVTYWDWLYKQPSFPIPTPSFESPIPAPIDDDTTKPLISPRSGRIMRKFKVGSGLGFSIDYESNSGFWLDEGEYKALCNLNLHDELHLICSPEYQKELRQQQASETEQARFEQRIGAQECDRIQSFANWITTLPSREHALVYLQTSLDKADENMN